MKLFNFIGGVVNLLVMTYGFRQQEYYSATFAMAIAVMCWIEYAKAEWP